MKLRKQDPFNWKKLKGMGGIGALGFLMLFQYQNCAPANGMHASKSSGDGLVTTIDDVNLTTDVVFRESQVIVTPSDDPTLLEGDCSANQEGAVLGWKVRDGQGHMRETGYANCEQGHFEVQIAPSNEMDCDQVYDVSAQLAAGSSGHVQVSRDCSSLASN